MSRNLNKPFTCYVIGEGNLTVQCLDVLDNNQHNIAGILSTDEKVLKWAERHRIPNWQILDDWLSETEPNSVDYVFSIASPVLLPTNALEKAKIFTINYHDSLLPSYAGVHATSWAIINKESEHGITWHLVDKGIDTGDILKQVRIPITNDETALSLNLKCHQAALESFKALVEALSIQTHRRTPQNLAKRSYYSYRKKPIANGIIDWHQSARDIECLHRALSIGNYANQFSVLKLLVRKQVYLVESLSWLPNISRKPGQVIEINNKQFRLATIEGDIVIAKLKTLLGDSISIEEFAQRTKLKTGDILEPIEQTAKDKFAQLSEQLFPKEKSWVQALNYIHPVSLPYLQNTGITPDSTIFKEKFEILELKQISSKGLEPVACFVTIWLIYLYRLNDYQPITIGFSSQRLRKLVQGVSAFFTDVVPLTADLKPNLDFAQASKLIGNVLKEITSQQTYLVDIRVRYPKLKQAQNIKKLPFQIFIGRLSENPQILAPTVIHFDPERLSYQLCLQVASKQKNYVESLADKIHGHLLTLIHNVIENPEKILVELQFLSPIEHHQLLAQASTFDADEPHLHKTIAELFTTQATKKPNAPAILFQGNRITYKELNQFADSLANVLLASCIKPKTPIAIFSHRCPEAIIAMLAIIKVGAFYVPINPDYPSERISFIIEDANIHCILMNDDHSLEKFHKSCANSKDFQCINVTEFMLTKNREANEVNIQGCAEDIAYLLYTSGSTGKPKGVLVPQKGLSRLVKMHGSIEFCSQDYVVQLANLVFDAAMFEIWGGLLNGATLHIIDKETEFDFYRLADSLSRNSSFLFMTPTVFKEVINVVPYAFDNLRILMLGGEAVRTSMVEALLIRVKNHNLNLIVVNGYGPTENTAISTSYIINSDLCNSTIIPIGRPIAHTQTYVLDKYQQLLPSGVPGELCLGGTGVARGYLNRPLLSRDAFIDNPFSAKFSKKIYRSGDRVRWLAGDLEFIGRNDSQIKIHGIRVELGEIEHRLLKYPMIKQTVVTCQTNQSMQSMLVAYVVPRNTVTLNINLVRQYLEQHLQTYMIPSNILVLDKLPVTINGKLDKTKLPTLNTNKNSYSYLAPKNHIEKCMVTIWRKIFNLRKVSLTDDYYRLGGDSITAMQISSQASKIGLKVKVRDILNYSTVGHLCKFIKPIKSTVIQHKLPYNNRVSLTPIQQWFFTRNLKAPNQFSNYVLLKSKVSLTIKQVEAVFSQLIKQHDMLRAYFYVENGSWRQKISQYCVMSKVSRFTFNSAQSEFEIWLKLRAINLQKKLELSQPPLVKVAIIEGYQRTTHLLIIIHHLIIDGISWRVLIEDLAAYIHNLENNTKASVTTIANSYATWSNHLNKLAGTSAIKGTYDYWSTAIPISYNLPLDYPRGKNTTVSESKTNINVDQSLTQLILKDIPEKHKIKPHEILIVALCYTLSLWSKQEDIYLDMEHHGREVVNETLELSQTIGWFTALFPVSIKVSTRIPHNWEMLVKLVKSQLREVPNDGLSYGILRYLCKDKSLSGLLSSTSEAEISFNYLGQFPLQENKILTMTDQPIYLVSGIENMRTHLFDIMAWVKAGVLTISWSYSRNCHNLKTIELLVGNLADNIKVLTQALHAATYPWTIPQDYPFSELRQRNLDKLIQHYPKLSNILPLSPIQQGLLFHKTCEDHDFAYHIQVRWHDPRVLDLKYYKLAWEHILARFEVLRAQFIWNDLEKPVQVINSSVQLPWKVYDLEELSAKNQQLRITAIINQDKKQTFDLSKAPLMRITVFSLTHDNHIIIWTHHHILLDGWSLNLVLNDLYEIYEAYIKNNQARLQTTPSYSAYIRSIQQSNKRYAKRFWVSYFKGYSNIGSLPLIKTAGSLATQVNPKMESETLALSQLMTKSLKAFTVRSKVTLSTVTQFAWVILLYRYTHLKDIITGITLSTRSKDHSDIEQLVAPLINTLPFQFTIKLKETIREGLERIKYMMQEFIKYNETALIHIKSWLAKEKTNIIFNSLFVFENYPLEIRHLHISDLTIEDYTHYPLTMVVRPDRTLKLKLLFDNSIYKRSSAKQMLMHFHELLNQIINFPDKIITQLTMLTQGEQQKLTDNNKYINFSAVESLSELFEQKVNLYANNVALIYKDKQITYAELNNKANQLANYLIKIGVKPNDFVVLYLERDINVIVSILAALKAGCTYIPIDPDYPELRIRYIIKDSKASTLVTLGSLTKEFKQPLDFKYQVNLDNAFEAIKLEQCNNLGLKIPPDSPAYVIYTSGSTGAPKGVIITHLNIIRLFHATKSYYNFNEDDVWTLFHSFAFDFSVWEIWGALLYSGKLVIVSYLESRTPELFYQLLIMHKVTILNQTPLAFKQLTNHIQDVKTEKASNLRLVIFGGERLNTKEINFQVWLSGSKKEFLRFVNMYGITEATVHATYFPINLETVADEQGSIIGKPLPDLGFHLLDKDHIPVPQGIIGEIYIEGDGLSPGYLNNPNLTQQKFILSPIDSNSILYKTGDLARYLPNGNMIYEGRVDDQIKIRGFRIALGEIEHTIQQFPGASQVVVLRGQGYQGLDILLTFLVVVSKDTFNVNQLRNFIDQRLPSHMRPCQYLILDKFPLTVHGKIDKNALLALQPKPINKNKQQTTATAGEKMLLDIWHNLLPVQLIHPDDDFFDMGGHSILALQLLSKIQSIFSIDLTMRDIFESPTISKLWSRILVSKTRKIVPQQNSQFPIMQIQSKGAKNPIFLVHPVGGTIFWFRSLARYIKGEHPIYAIQDPGLEDRKLWFVTFEQMAQYYVQAIQHMCPSGPYLLGGASFGATMAVEMASQLIKKGEQIQAVISFDGWAHYPKILNTREFLNEHMWRQHEDFKKKLNGIAANLSQPFIDLHWHRANLLANYQLRPFNFDFIHFKAEKTLGPLMSLESTTNHWEKYAQCLKRVMVPGDHESMFYEPQVQVLASILDNELGLL